MGRRFIKESGDKKVVVDIYPPELFHNVADYTRMPNWQKAVSEHEVVMYNGHSILGTGMAFERVNYPDRYQIFQVASCLSYEYYVRPILEGKGGWENVDVVSNVKPTYYTEMLPLTSTILAKLIEGFENNGRTSWQGIMEAVSRKVHHYRFGVSGARDNCFTPEGNRCEPEPEPEPGVKTYSNETATDIPDNDPQGVTSTISVPDAMTIAGLKLELDITHTWVGDLEVIVSHGGLTATVWSREGGSDDDIQQTFVLRAFEGTRQEGFLKERLLRALARARYSHENIGHHGLASRAYLHFTSPIRRYPDLLVHRQVWQMIQGGKPGTLERVGKYEVRFAAAPDELRAIQKLRFEVFNLELGEGLEESFRTGRDEDPFDPFCHHLMVIHRESGRVAGTYRLQTDAMAARFGGFYSGGEFDLGGMPPEVIENAVEVGRACVARNYRSRQVLFLLWRGLAAYIQKNRKRYLFGCCSLTSQDPVEGKRVMDHLAREGETHPGIRIRPQPGWECYDEQNPPSIPAAGDPVSLPQLFRIYLRYGAKVCGPPAIDRLFKTIDYLVVLDTEELDRETREMFFR